MADGSKLLQWCHIGLQCNRMVPCACCQNVHIYLCQGWCLLCYAGEKWFKSVRALPQSCHFEKDRKASSLGLWRNCQFCPFCVRSKVSTLSEPWLAESKWLEWSHTSMIEYIMRYIMIEMDIFETDTTRNSAKPVVTGVQLCIFSRGTLHFHPLCCKSRGASFKSCPVPAFFFQEND